MMNTFLFVSSNLGPYNKIRTKHENRGKQWNGKCYILFSVAGKKIVESDEENKSS